MIGSVLRLPDVGCTISKEERCAAEDRVGDEAAEKAGDAGKFNKFWKEFGKMLKMGVIEDSGNRQRLAKLLRFYTSTSPKDLTSLEEYVERMKPKQKHVYFITGAPRTARPLPECTGHGSDSLVQVISPPCDDIRAAACGRLVPGAAG